MKSASILLTLALAAGCLSGSRAISEGNSGVKKLAAQAPLITTGIDVADCQLVADQLAKSLLESKAFREQPADRKSLVALSQIFNRTPIRTLNTHLITHRLFDAINKDGRVEITQNIGVIADGSTAVVDDVGLGVDDLKRLRAGDKGIRIPDLTISGEIISLQSKAGKTRETTYHFHLVLAKGNLVLWQDSVEIRKTVNALKSR
jgi:PBP1b-binding outer membrane lipoprotein LpoB